MAEHTKLNLRELEDQAPKFGLAANLQARFAREALGLERSGMSLQRLAPGFRHPFGHRQKEQEEVYVVVAGSGRAKLDDEIVELEAWDALRVPPETTRAFEAGTSGLELLVFGAPAQATTFEDAEPVPGWWED